MTKSQGFIKNFMWAIILFALPLPLTFAVSNGIDPYYQASMLPINLGIYAYVWMLAAIFLASRPQWIENTIGLPSKFMTNGLAATMALVIVELHATGLQALGLAAVSGQAAFMMVNGLAAYAIIFAAAWLVKHVPALQFVKKAFAPFQSAKAATWINGALAATVAVTFVHVASISYINAIPAFMFLFVAYTLVGFAPAARSLVARIAQAREAKATK